MKTPLPPWSAGGAAKVPRFVGCGATGSFQVAKLRRSPAHRGAARHVGPALRMIPEVAGDSAPRDAHGGHPRAPRALYCDSPSRARLRDVQADPAACGRAAGARCTIWLGALGREHHRYSFGACAARRRLALAWSRAVQWLWVPRQAMRANLAPPASKSINTPAPYLFRAIPRSRAPRRAPAPSASAHPPRSGPLRPRPRRAPRRE